MTTTTALELQFLYLIASGKDDGVYKIGISNEPARRLEQIKDHYGVPNAYILESMDVGSRDEVFAIEQGLHTKYADCLAAGYEGREWFKLTDNQLHDLRQLYQTESDTFAQAVAFFGYVEERAALQERAEKMEDERQAKITHNRRHGKRYDTKPKGILKRYNDLVLKETTSLLGLRFDIDEQPHPITKLVDEGVSEVNKEVATRTAGQWFFVGLGGLILGGALAGSVNAPVGPIAWASGIVGAVSGGLTTSRRREEESTRARDSLKVLANHANPGALDSKRIFVADKKTGSRFLIKDFHENQARIRDLSPRDPVVSLPASIQVVNYARGLNYFPTNAVIATGLAAAFLTGINAETEARNQAYLQLTPITTELIT